jgi:hypothetical protein
MVTNNLPLFLIGATVRNHHFEGGKTRPPTLATLRRELGTCPLLQIAGFIVIVALAAALFVRKLGSLVHSEVYFS